MHMAPAVPGFGRPRVEMNTDERHFRHAEGIIQVNPRHGWVIDLGRCAAVAPAVGGNSLLQQLPQSRDIASEVEFHASYSVQQVWTCSYVGLALPNKAKRDLSIVTRALRGVQGVHARFCGRSPRSRSPSAP